MHPRHISNTIRKRMREATAKMYEAKTIDVGFSVLMDFAEEMDLLAARIDAEEDEKETK